MRISDLSSDVCSSDLYRQEQSVKAAGRAFSGETADTGPDSLWWNPAAIGGIERPSAYLGLSAILPKSHVDDSGTLIVRPGQDQTGRASCRERVVQYG